MPVLSRLHVFTVQTIGLVLRVFLMRHSLPSCNTMSPPHAHNSLSPAFVCDLLLAGLCLLLLTTPCCYCPLARRYLFLSSQISLQLRIFWCHMGQWPSLIFNSSSIFPRAFDFFFLHVLSCARVFWQHVPPCFPFPACSILPSSYNMFRDAFIFVYVFLCVHLPECFALHLFVSRLLHQYSCSQWNAFFFTPNSRLLIRFGFVGHVVCAFTYILSIINN